MRLTCPNCRAQYDVPDTAIPDDGRDVECSNCAHSWFQTPPRRPAPLTLDEDALVPPGGPPPRTRKLDPELEAVLRDEAQRESRARAADSGGRSQVGPAPSAAKVPPSRDIAPPARGLGDVPPDGATDQPKATALGDPPPAKEPAAARTPPPRRRDTAGRSDPFPDVDEINPTLRSASEQRGLKPKSPVAPPVSDGPAQDSPAAASASSAPSQSASAPSRYSEGAIWGLCLAMGGVAVYLATPWITDQLPGSAIWLAPFSEGIDAARLWMFEIVHNSGADGT